MKIPSSLKLKVADEVWVACALLHKEHPEARDFSIEEIVERARQERPGEELRPSVYAHVVQHCVGNRPPSPGRYRMLFETGSGRRRLFRQGDPYNHKRDGSKMTPAPEDLGSDYGELLNWYEEWSEEARRRSVDDDPLLKAAGSGKHLWADEDPDEYVRRLREGWE